MPLTGMRANASGPGSAEGILASTSDHVARRTANTAVAVATTPSAWCASMIQCWVERLVRAGLAKNRISPSATGAAKLTVSRHGIAQALGVQHGRLQ